MAVKDTTVCNIDLSGTLKKAYAALDELYIGDIKDKNLQRVLEEAISQVKEDLGTLARKAQKTAKAADGGEKEQIAMGQSLRNLSRYRNIIDTVGKAVERHKTWQAFAETSRRLNGRIDDEAKRSFARYNAIVKQGFEGQMVGDGTHTANNVVQQAYDLFEDARAGGTKLVDLLSKEGFANPQAAMYQAMVNGHHKSNKILNVIGKSLKPGAEALRREMNEAIPGNQRVIREGLDYGAAKERLRAEGPTRFFRFFNDRIGDWQMTNTTYKADATEKASSRIGQEEWSAMSAVARRNEIKREYIKRLWQELNRPRTGFHAQKDMEVVWNKGHERSEFAMIQKFSTMGTNPVVDQAQQYMAHAKRTALERTFGKDIVAGHGIQQNALVESMRGKGFKQSQIDDLIRYDNNRFSLLQPLADTSPGYIQRTSNVLNNMASAGYLGKVAAKRFVVDGMMIPALHRLAYTNSPLRAAATAIQGLMSSFSSIGQAALRADAYKALEFELETAGLRIRLSNNMVSQHLDESAKATAAPQSLLEWGADKAAQGVSALTGADAQYMGHTVDAVVSLGRDMLWMSQRKLNDLPQFAQYYFKRNGIGEKEWGLLKKLPTMQAPIFNLNKKNPRNVDVMPDFRAIRDLKDEAVAPFARQLEDPESTRLRLEADYMAAFEDALYERFARPTQQDRIGGVPSHDMKSVVQQHLYRFIPIASKQWRGWNRAIRAMSNLDPADSSVRGFFEAAATSPKAWVLGGTSLAAVAQGGMFIEMAEDLIAGNVPQDGYFNNPERWAHAIMQTGFLYPINAVANLMVYNKGKLNPSVPSMGVLSSVLKPGVATVKEAFRRGKGKAPSPTFETRLKRDTFRSGTYLFPFSRMWFFQGLMNTLQREQFGLSDNEKSIYTEDRTMPWEHTPQGRRLIREIERR